MKMLKNAEGAYSFDQESIELNSYLCAEKFYLAYLLDEVGEKEQAARFREEGKKLKKTIQEKFFDEETGFFYDRKLGTGELVKVIDISGWIPLFTKVATPEQAAAVKKNMLDKELFGTYFPFSSLNHKHPLYQPDKGLLPRTDVDELYLFRYSRLEELWFYGKMRKSTRGCCRTD